MVGMLESPLPAEYVPAKLLPSGYERWIGQGRLIPVLHLNKQRKAFVVQLPILSSQGSPSEISTEIGTSLSRYAFSWTVAAHDSGNPCFMLVGNERVLLYATHFRQTNGLPGGPHTARFSTEIQAALDALSDAAAMPRALLQFFDFSSFTNLQLGELQ